MRFAAICLALAAIAAIGIAIAENKAVPDGTIYGHVYDAQTKEPIPQAFVYCQETKCPKQLTDSNGYYAIENCFSPSTSYNIECTKNGYPTVKKTAETDSIGKAKVDFNLGNTPNLPQKSDSNPTQVKSWKKIFGGPGDDSSISVQQTTDDGFINVGYTDSFGAGKKDVWLVKTDADGNKLWDKTFGGLADDLGVDVQQTDDGGYIIIGSTKSYGSGSEDIWLIKADSNGNKLWDKTFGGIENDYGASVRQTNDGGYVIAGEANKNGANLKGYFWLIKSDANGNKIWDKIFGQGVDNLIDCCSVRQTRDNGYIIIGHVSLRVWLIKTDSTGDILWDKTFGSLGGANSIQQTSDDGFIFTGGALIPTSNGESQSTAYLAKTNSSGNTQWVKTFSKPEPSMAQAVQQTSDGGYIIISGGFGTEAFLIKTDAQGNKLWEKTFSGSGNSIQQTRDGGYIALGETNSYGAGNRDVWLIKIDSEGN